MQDPIGIERNFETAGCWGTAVSLRVHGSLSASTWVHSGDLKLCFGGLLAGQCNGLFAILNDDRGTAIATTLERRAR